MKINMSKFMRIKFAAKISKLPRINNNIAFFGGMSFVKRIRRAKSKYAEAATQAGIKLRELLFISILLASSKAVG